MPRGTRRKTASYKLKKQWTENLQGNWDLSAPFLLNNQQYILAYDADDGKIRCWSLSFSNRLNPRPVSTSDDHIPPAGLSRLVPFKDTAVLLGVMGNLSAPVIIQLSADNAQGKDIGASFFTLGGLPPHAIFTPIIYQGAPHLLVYDGDQGTLTIYGIDLSGQRAVPYGTFQWGTGWTAMADTQNDQGANEYFIAYNSTNGAFRAGWIQGTGTGITITPSDLAPDQATLPGYSDMTPVVHNDGPTFLIYARNSQLLPRVYTITFGPPLTLNQKDFDPASGESLADINEVNSFVLSYPSSLEFYLFTQSTQTAALKAGSFTLTAYSNPKPGYPG